MKKAIVMLLMVALFLATAGCENSVDAAALPANAEGSSTVESSSSTVEVSSTVESSSMVESSSSTVESSSSLPTSSSLPEIPEANVPEVENPTAKPSTGNKNEPIEVEGNDPRTFEAGVGVSFDTSYSNGMSRKEVFADISEIVSTAGLVLMDSGTIGSGASNSSGYIALDDSDGTWKLYIYAWRSSPTDSGLNQTVNSTLQVFKYFLGTENGSTLWSFIDASFTKQDPSVSDYNMTDTEYEGKTGEFTFSNGNNVGYDQSNSPRYIVFTLS